MKGLTPADTMRISDRVANAAMDGLWGDLKEIIVFIPELNETWTITRKPS